MNVTLSIPDHILTQARKRASRQATTINNLIRDFLEDYSQMNEKQKIACEAIDFFNSVTPTIPANERITREEMEER